MDNNQVEKSIKGYKVLIMILVVILAALTFFHFMQVQELRGSKEELSEQRDTLFNRLTDMISDFDSISTENDTINANLTIERQKADSLMTRLKEERNLSLAKIRRYEKELGTLRVVMRGYVRQIDSLNTLNQTLSKENIEYRKTASTLRLRAESAEERAQELDVKVQKGSIILARNIMLKALNNSDREVSKASRAARLRADFVLTANDLATPGSREVYVRIVGPDGYLLSGSTNNIFEFEGERLAYSASRNIDYQNRDLNVNVYYNGGGIAGGKYSVSIYLDSRLIGSNEIILK